jgi:hypothetical protein
MALADDYDHWARSFPARVARGWRTFLEAIEAAVVPHYSPGSGDWNVIAHLTFSCFPNGTVKISAFDLVRSVQGGAASPTYTFYIRKDGAAYGAGHSNPKDEYVTFSSPEVSPETNLVYVKVSDGTTTSTETEIAVVLSS